MGYAKGHSPPALGCILQLADNVLGLLPRFHPRHHHTPGANVQSARQRCIGHVGNTCDGNNFAAAARRDHLREQGNIATSVLHIEDHEIESACSEHGSDAGGKEFEHHLAQKNISLAEPLRETWSSSASIYRKRSFVFRQLL